MKKRSVTIAGHRTAVTLEDAFWTELQELARAQSVSLNALVTRIDDTRDPAANLSSALRVYVLHNVKNQSAD